MIPRAIWSSLKKEDSQEEEVEVVEVVAKGKRSRRPSEPPAKGRPREDSTDLTLASRDKAETLSDKQEALNRGMSVEEWLKDKKEKSVKEWLTKSVDPAEEERGVKKKWVHSLEVNENPERKPKSSDELIDDIFAAIKNGADTDQVVRDILSDGEIKASSEGEDGKKKGGKEKSEYERRSKKKKRKEKEKKKKRSDDSADERKKKKKKKRSDESDSDSEDEYKRKKKKKKSDESSDNEDDLKRKERKKKKKKSDATSDDDEKRKKKKRSEESEDEAELREIALKSISSESPRKESAAVTKSPEKSVAKVSEAEISEIKVGGAKVGDIAPPGSYNANVSLPTEEEIKNKSDQLLDDLFIYMKNEKQRKDEEEALGEEGDLMQDVKVDTKDEKEKEKKSRKRSASRGRKSSDRRRSRSRGGRSTEKKTSRKGDRRSRSRRRSRSGRRSRSDRRSRARSSSQQRSGSRPRSRSQELLEAAEKFEKGKRGRLRMKQHLINQSKLLKIAKEQVKGNMDTLKELSVQCMEIARKGLEDEAAAPQEMEEEGSSSDEEELRQVVLHVYATPSMMRISKSNSNYKNILNGELEKYGQLGSVTGFWMTPQGYDKAYEKTIGDGMGGKRKGAVYRPTGTSLLAIGMEGHAVYEKVYLPTTVRVDTKWPDKWENKGLIKTIFARASLYGDINISDCNPHGRSHPPTAFPTASGTAPQSMQESSTALVLHNPNLEPKGPYNPFSKEAKEWEKQKNRQALLEALLPGGSCHPESRRLEIEDHHVPFNPFSKEAKEAERLKKLEEKEARRKEKGKGKKGKEVEPEVEEPKKKGGKPPQFNPFLEGFRPSSYGYGEV